MYLDQRHVEEVAGCADPSSSFLSLVEEAVCVQAAHFLGTHVSSISQSMGFVRLASGLRRNEYFESTDRC
jgi:hypothetical protein